MSKLSVFNAQHGFDSRRFHQLIYYQQLEEDDAGSRIARVSLNSKLQRWTYVLKAGPSPRPLPSKPLVVSHELVRHQGGNLPWAREEL
jgi:hypothetical protein